MALDSAESHGKKCLDLFPGKHMTDRKTAWVDHIQVVIRDLLTC
jgi:hypothetical protein